MKFIPYSEVSCSCSPSHLSASVPCLLPQFKPLFPSFSFSALFGPLTLIQCSAQLRLRLGPTHTLNTYPCKDRQILQANAQQHTLNGKYTLVLRNGKVEVVSVGPL